MKMIAVFLATQILESFGDLNVPPVRNIPGTSISISLYFVGDEAFPLQPRT